MAVPENVSSVVSFFELFFLALGLAFFLVIVIVYLATIKAKSIGKVLSIEVAQLSMLFLGVGAFTISMGLKWNDTSQALNFCQSRQSANLPRAQCSQGYAPIRVEPDNNITTFF